MEGRSVDKTLQFCDFNSAATRFYKQQLIPSATLPENAAPTKAKASAVQPWQMGIDFPVL
jgi:hypothetical protein